MCYLACYEVIPSRSYCHALAQRIYSTVFPGRTRTARPDVGVNSVIGCDTFFGLVYMERRCISAATYQTILCFTMLKRVTVGTSGLRPPHNAPNRCSQPHIAPIRSWQDIALGMGGTRRFYCTQVPNAQTLRTCLWVTLCSRSFCSRQHL